MAIRFHWGWLSDNISFKKTYAFILLMNVIFGFTLPLVRSNRTLYFIWICIIVHCEGGHFTLVPTICAKLFGKHAALVYGVAFSFGGVANVVTSILVKTLLADIGFIPFYVIASSLSLAALIILLVFFKEEKVC